MATTKINGNRQIQDETITNNQIALDAAIALSKLEEPVIQADGDQAFTAPQSMGGYELTSVGDPMASTSAANRSYVDGAIDAVAVQAYIHDQITPSVTWTIPHNLGFYPNVSVVDSGGNEVEGVITYIDVDNLQVAFTDPFGGKAFLS